MGGGAKEEEEEKGRPKLVDYHALPVYLRDNEYVLRHYRAEWPVKHLLRSVFAIHNETLNIWTHLIGFLLFASLTVSTAMDGGPHKGGSWDGMQVAGRGCLLRGLESRPNGSHVCLLQGGFNSSLAASAAAPITFDLPPAPSKRRPSVPRWPIFVFLGGAAFCLLSSSLCHTLSCHSRRLSYHVHLLDYVGIAVLISTSFFPTVYYSFLHHPVTRLLYLSSISFLALATVALSLLPAFHSPRFRAARTLAFLCMGASGALPVLHKASAFRGTPEAATTTMLEVEMGVMYAVGALVYAARVPERWRPGWFDVVGSSHQVFHVMVLAAAYVHYHAGLVYLRWRAKDMGC